MIQSNGTWREENASEHMLVYMHLSDTDESSLLSLFSTLSFIFILISCLSHPVLFVFVPAFASSFCRLSTDQRLDLNKLSPNDSDTVRGQIVGEYRSTCKQRCIWWHKKDFK